MSETKTQAHLRREVAEVWSDLRNEEQGTLDAVLDLFESDEGLARLVTQDVLDSLASNLFPVLEAIMHLPDENVRSQVGSEAFKVNVEHAVDAAFYLGMAIGHEHHRRGMSLDATTH